MKRLALTLSFGASLLLLLSLTLPVTAQSPWGHAPKHGMTGTDVLRHVSQADLVLRRWIDGKWIVVSGWSNRPGYPFTTSVHSPGGRVETAFPMKAAKGGRYIQNQVRNGYMASSVPPMIIGTGAVVGACVTWVAGTCTDLAWSTVGWTAHGVTPSNAMRNIQQSRVN